MSWRQWVVELSVLALAVARALIPIPFISGHALFLTYAILTVTSPTARWTVATVLIEVIYIKVCVLHDATLIGGIVVGILAALLVKTRHLAIGLSI
jgi:hypothetical protein